LEETLPSLLALVTLTFLVGFVYSSVGHGGASGYLAILSFFAFPHEQMAASALCLNLLVAGTAFFAFRKAGHFSWKLTWPFVITSVPAALLGGLTRVSPILYTRLLAAVLVFAGVRLLIERKSGEGVASSEPKLWISLPTGAGVGLLSGVVGVGGGIFLSPLLLLFRWAGTKETAATSALFIFVNSLAGLGGRFLRHDFSVLVPPVMLLMVVNAFLGGLVGSRLGANHFSAPWLKRVLAVVLFVAAFKLFRIS
jgi:uncharacterized membrane protein YfcA